MWQFQVKSHPGCIRPSVKCQEIIKHEGALTACERSALEKLITVWLLRHHGKNNTQDNCVPLWLQRDVFELVVLAPVGAG